MIDWHWANPWSLLLLVFPVLAWLRYRGQETTSLRFGAGHLLGNISLGIWAKLAWLPRALRVAALTLLALAVARPQAPSPELVSREGIDIVVVLDLSGSMGRSLRGRRASVYDPPRLEVAKEVLKKEFLSKRPNDRIGLVVFGAEAYTRAPLTLDHTVLTSMVDDLSTDLFDQEFASSTALGDALGVAVNRLKRATSRTKAIVLLTDGVSNSGVSAPEDAGKAAAEKNVKIYPILIGSEQGEELDPTQLDQLAELTKTAPEIVAAQGDVNRKHFAAYSPTLLQNGLRATLNALDRSQIQAAGKEAYQELGPYLGFVALLLLLLEATLRLWRYQEVA